MSVRLFYKAEKTSLRHSKKPQSAQRLLFLVRDTKLILLLFTVLKKIHPRTSAVQGWRRRRKCNSTELASESWNIYRLYI